MIDKKIDYIIEKIDHIDSRLNKIEIIQSAMSQDLKYHIKRTDLLEKELKPIKTKYQQLVGIMKFVGGVFAILTLFEGFIKIFYH